MPKLLFAQFVLEMRLKEVGQLTGEKRLVLVGYLSVSVNSLIPRKFVATHASAPTTTTSLKALQLLSMRGAPIAVPFIFQVVCKDKFTSQPLQNLDTLVKQQKQHWKHYLSFTGSPSHVQRILLNLI
jgi:hypothetical protein